MAADFAPAALVWFVASTHRVASEFEFLAEKVFKPSELMPLRVHSSADAITDLGTAWLQSVVDAATTEEVSILSTVDTIITFLSGLTKKNAWARLESLEGTALGKLIARLLAGRHEHLDQHVYACCETVQGVVVDQLKLVSTTTGTLMKLKAHDSRWYKWFPEDRCFLLLVDELPSESVEVITALVTRFKNMVAGGDEHQFRDAQMPGPMLPPRLPGSRSTGQRTNRSPLDWHNAAAWLRQLSKNSPDVEHTTGWEEFLYGKSTLELIERCFLSCRRLFAQRISQILW